MLGLYAAVATRSFRRYSTYSAATLAGIFTNCVFGVIICYVYLALWDEQPHAGGYTATDAVTYVWLGQAMIMTVMVWGGGATADLADRIRSGDVSIDLYRPVPLIGWYVAQDLGRAAYHLLTRGVAPDPRRGGAVRHPLPGDAAAWLGFAAAIPHRGAGELRDPLPRGQHGVLAARCDRADAVVFVLASFFSGLTVPLVIFPGWARDVVMALPWATFLQVPADIWLGKREGWDVVLGPRRSGPVWAAVLLGVCWLVLRQATRKVVVQGG